MTEEWRPVPCNLNNLWLGICEAALYWTEEVPVCDECGAIIGETDMAWWHKQSDHGVIECSRELNRRGKAHPSLKRWMRFTTPVQLLANSETHSPATARGASGALERLASTTIMVTPRHDTRGNTHLPALTSPATKEPHHDL